MIHNIPQPEFEKFVSEYLARDKNVDVRKGVSFVSLEQVSWRTVPHLLMTALTNSGRWVRFDGGGRASNEP